MVATVKAFCSCGATRQWDAPDGRVNETALHTWIAQHDGHSNTLVSLDEAGNEVGRTTQTVAPI